jgi:uncharacterized protein
MRHNLIQVELATTAGLLGLAAAWSSVRGLNLQEALHPSADAIAIGCAAGLGFAAMLPVVTASWAPRVRLLRGLRRAWNGLEFALGNDLRLPHILLLALCSAVSEELFFRGVLQSEFGLLVSSAAFGLLHPFGIAYVAWATVAGLGLGTLFSGTGSLVAPTAAHATYNLLALVYLSVRATRPEEYA